jgi:hypothetical protein
LIVALQNLSPHGALRFATSHDLGNPEYLNNAGVGDSHIGQVAYHRLPRNNSKKKPEHYGNACKVVLNKYGSSYSVRSPAFLPGTGCSRAESGLFHFTASDATSA